MAITDIKQYTHLTQEDIEQLGRELDAIRTDIEESRGESDARLIHAVLEGSYDPPEQVVADYPPDLATIVARAPTSVWEKMS